MVYPYGQEGVGYQWDGTYVAGMYDQPDLDDDAAGYTYVSCDSDVHTQTGPIDAEEGHWQNGGPNDAVTDGTGLLDWGSQRAQSVPRVSTPNQWPQLYAVAGASNIEQNSVNISPALHILPSNDSSRLNAQTGRRHPQQEIPRVTRSASSTPTPAFICEYCEKALTTQHGLTRHKQSVHGEYVLIYICSDCTAFDVPRKDKMKNHAKQQQHSYQVWRKIVNDGSSQPIGVPPNPHLLYRCSDDACKQRSHVQGNLISHQSLKGAEHDYSSWLLVDTVEVGSEEDDDHHLENSLEEEFGD